MTKTLSQRPAITDYDDYRDFLKDLFEHEKKRRKAFSFQFCGSRLGTSKAYLKLVIQKKRHISLAKVAQIWALFKLDAYEQQFFTLLFLKATSDDEKLIEYFGFVLGQLKHRLKYSGTHEGRPSSDEKEVVFKDGLRMIIHSLARFPDFKPEAAWIHERLVGGNTSMDEVQLALNSLLESGSIRKKEGRWQPDEFVFHAPGAFDGDRFRVYKIGVQQTSAALDDVSKHKPGHYHMMSIGLDAAGCDQLTRLYIEFRDKVIALSKETKEPEKVLFLSNNFFCVAKAPSEPVNGVTKRDL